MQLRFLLPAAVLATCLLHACSYYSEPSQLEANIVAPGNFKTGAGVIRNVGVLPNANKTGSRSGNRPPDPNLYRLLVEMNASGFQSVDIDASTFLVGELIDITNDGRVVRLSGTSFNKLLGER
ncbi:MAG TPA: hypothetical protein VNC62_12570 [Burkholderiales bacterium]|jgi:hypothetical protein|nr:hypothetical protein [Burkholderiales bacterium]